MPEDNKRRALLAVLSEFKYGQVSINQCIEEVEQIYQHHENQNQESKKED